MGKHKRKAHSKGPSRPPASGRGLLIGGVLAVAVLAGLATWYFLPRQSPLGSVPPYTGGARLAVDRELIDFGTVRFDKFVQARFRLRNVGDQPLRLAAGSPVEVVEGCWPPEAVVGSTTLQPGKETEVWTQFTMHQGMGGPHLFIIRLKTNDAVQPERELKIRSFWQG